MVRYVQHLDAGVREVGELGGYERGDERQRKAEKAQAYHEAEHEALICYGEENGRSRAHEDRLHDEHDDGKRNKQFEKRPNLAHDVRIGARSERERKQRDEHDGGIRRERRSDERDGERDLGDRIQPVEQRGARYVIDDINHEAPAPRCMRRHLRPRRARGTGAKPCAQARSRAQPPEGASCSLAS